MRVLSEPYGGPARQKRAVLVPKGVLFRRRRPLTLRFFFFLSSPQCVTLFFRYERSKKDVASIFCVSSIIILSQEAL